MNSLLDRVSSYNLFNYLLPGTLFAVFLEAVTGYEMPTRDLVLGLFLYYFIGLVISRIGSLIIEPLLRKMRLVRTTEYAKYVMASRRDSRIEILSEVNNAYRTLLALFVVLLLVKISEPIVATLAINSSVMQYAGLVGLAILFATAYRKQTDYITRRIEQAIRRTEGREL